MKYWEKIAEKLSNAGWSWGCVSTVDSNGRTIFVADAHRDNGKRFIVSADEKLTAFLELEKSNARIIALSFLRWFSSACAPLRMLGVSAILDSRRVVQNCAVLRQKHFRP